ncbi:MAG TPA: HNH endonuclease signature motif containing protein [Streptosporangiaceae bacterium]|nr:HNH endonuclease signature motif containing protein [Streptosporangiaceae bacterium]
MSERRKVRSSRVSAARASAARARAAASPAARASVPATGAETATPSKLPPMDVSDLLMAQRAAIEDLPELSPAEIAALPFAADVTDDPEDEAPWWLFDSLGGSPDAEHESWLRSLPAEIRAAYESGPWDGAGEFLAAGFYHHDDDGLWGLDFAADGQHDRLRPGPELAAAVAHASQDDHELGESELIGVLCAWQRLTSWAQAGQAACLNGLVQRRKHQSVELDRPALAGHVDDEAAAALSLTGRAAGRLLQAAVTLGRLPDVLQALAAGRIDWVKACLFTDLLAGLPDDVATAIARTVLAGADHKTSGQLRAALARAVLAYDPASAQRRREAAAREDASVQLWNEPSGNCGLAGRELPAADAVNASARLTAAARWLSRHGAEGTTDQLRATALIALLIGRPLDTLLPARSSGSADPASADSDSADSASAAPVSCDSDSADSASAAPVSCDSDSADSASADSAAAEADRPGAASSATPSSATPSSATASPATGIPDHELPEACLSGHGQPPLTGTINLTMPLSAWTGQTSAPGEVAGYGPADAATCCNLAGRTGGTAGTARWCLTLTGADGHAVAHACASGPPPPGVTAVAWARGLREKLQFLESGDCSHSRQSPRYRPPPNLVHLIRVRQRTCSFPGCRRPARRTDLDHTVAFHRGGMTCECNLAPLCRRHHQAKQAPRWHLSQDQPGVMTWELPSGRRYTVTPEPYPV